MIISFKGVNGKVRVIQGQIEQITRSGQVKSASFIYGTGSLLQKICNVFAGKGGKGEGV